MRFEISGFEKLINKLSIASEEVEQAFKTASTEFTPQARATIAATLVKAAANAGDEAFPLAYIEPMLAAVDNIIITGPTELLIDFEQLGTPEELQEGYHYGAKIEGGGQVDLPYGGEPLKNDTEQRYEAWQRVFHGETWHGINYAGVWNETIAARLDAWGDKAPQWLLLQYGQTEFDPIIYPYPLVEEVTFDLTAIFDGMLRLELNLIAAKFNKG